MSPPRGFAAEEHRARVAKAQALMAKAGRGALLLTTEAEFRYFTGFLTRFWESPTRPWFLILPAAGDPVAVIPSIGVPPMGRTWIAEVRAWPAPDYGDEGVGLLAETIRELAGPDATVGVPMGRESALRMPLADFERLKAALKPATIRDDDGIVARLRLVKSEAEIAKIAEACAIAGRAFARTPGIAREGAPLSEVFRRFQTLCLAEGADFVPYLAGAAGADGYADVISPADDRPLASGDVLMLDTGLTHDGYFCDFDRNYAVGRPSASAASGHARLLEAVDAAAERARPGATASALFYAMDAVVAGGGGAEGAGRLGHGLGMQLTEPPSIHPADHTALEEGMVLTFEPVVEIRPGVILVHEENIVVRADGPVFLSPR
ncbi:MAG: Xaa-Pro peptidase family protein [Pseudomonadota bacterium]